MSPVHRTLASSVLAFDLVDEMRIVRAELDAGHSRIARTLVVHAADGPRTALAEFGRMAAWMIS